MSAVLRLLAWLQVVKPALLDPKWLRKLAEEALEETSDEAISESLVAMLTPLRLGEACDDAFTRDHQHLLRGEAVADYLQEALLDYADLLPYWDWHTRAVVELEEGLVGDTGGLVRLQLRLVQIEREYDMPITNSNEITVETMVAHRCLSEGMAKWREALIYLAQRNAPMASGAAEVASRRLVALQRFRERQLELHGPGRFQLREAD